MSRAFSLGLATLVLAMMTRGVPLRAQEATPPPPPPPPPAPEAAIAAPAAAVLDQVKIIVDDKAKSDGEIRFLFTPQGGEAKTVRVTVQKGMGKQAVCKDMAKELSVALGSSYKVDQYDDDKVKVEGKGGAKFSLTVSAQTVTGLSVKLN